MSNTTGKAKRKNTISTQFSEFLRRRLGLAFNPHLVRHFAATNLLGDDAKALEVARQLLRHTSTDTTRKHYAHIDQQRSFSQYHALLERQRQAPGTPQPQFNFGRKRRSA